MSHNKSTQNILLKDNHRSNTDLHPHYVTFNNDNGLGPWDSNLDYQSLATNILGY